MTIPKTDPRKNGEVKNLEIPSKNDTSPQAGDPREPRHFSVRDGDSIYVDRTRFRLERNPFSDEKTEIIDVFPVSPEAQNPR